MPARPITLALLGSICLSSTAFAATTADESAILKIEQGMTASQSVQQSTVSWDKSAVLYDMLALNGKTATYAGINAVNSDFGPQFAAMTDIHAKILTMTIVADSRIGFAFSTQNFTAKSKTGGPDIDITFQETDCFQKKSGKWLLVHQHLSVPFDPKTGKAIFDSN